jgi:flagellin-like hook-associated protein FlgL
VTINVIGSDILTKPFTVLGDEADLAVGVNANTLLAELNDGRGIDLSPGIINVTDLNLNITVAVDVSLANDLNDVINSINTQLVAGGITNITAALGLEGNNISLSATDRPDVALSTPLVNLNQGSGIDISPPKFEIHNADHSISAVIDISSATTIGDVISAINSQLATAGVNNVTASMNPAGTGLQIQDTNGVPLGLSVSEYEADNGTAGDLGILGAISPTLIGTDLDPRPEFSVAESAVGETTAADLGIRGNMNYALVGNDLDPSITASTLVSLFNNGNGYGLDQIRISQGDATATVDLGLASIVTVQDMIDALNSTGLSITAAINSTSKGISITNTDPEKTLIIKDIRESKPAEAMGIAGSPDVMGSLLVLIDALRENNSEVVGSVIGGLDRSLDEVLNYRGSAGAKTIRLETTDLRLTEYSLSFTRLLSETEDVDITRLIADLAQQEAVYQSALNAAAKIIQPSLLDFLR